jgi:hypothetical protein
VLVLAGCASAAKTERPAAATVPPGTSIVAFHPYTEQGRPTLPVAETARGECWTTSIAAPVSGAYRCFQGNKILDPCFAPTSRQPGAPAQLACYAAPWDKPTMLHVVGALPTPGGPTTPPRPWALQLTSGIRCVASTGTVPAVQGVNLGYHCSDGGDAAVAGTAANVLTVHYAAPGRTVLQTLKVSTVWQP